MQRTLVLLLAALTVGACTGGGTTDQSSDDAETDDPFSAPHAPAQLLVMLEDPDEDDEIEELREELGLTDIQRIGQTAFFLIQVDSTTDLEALMKELDRDLRIVVTEPNYLAESPEGGPSDIPILGSDVLSSIAPQPAFANLDLAAAQAVTPGTGAVVAVVDTGIVDHTFFAPGQIDLANAFDFLDRDADPTDERNFTDDDGDGVTDEQYGHGTFVASMVLSVAPDARILPVRILDAEGFGTSSGVAAGIVWATDAGADVINLSVNIPNAPQVVKEAVNYARDRDVVVVAAAGNGAANQINFPARLRDVIGVAAADASGRVAPFSNVGPQVSFVAPGVDLVGAFPEGLTALGTANWSGTSFAAPLVAGSAALVRSAFPSLDRNGVAERLRDTATPVDALNPARAGRLGSGLVQPAAALR